MYWSTGVQVVRVRQRSIECIYICIEYNCTEDGQGMTTTFMTPKSTIALEYKYQEGPAK